jgi:uncharacterized membrane protein YidH (DUF202 family)
MAVALSIFGVAFAAFCVWLTVRIVNRREKWAERTLAAALIVALIGYPLSLGPFVWLRDHDHLGRDSADFILYSFYAPIVWIYYNGPASIRDAIESYIDLWQ